MDYINNSGDYKEYLEMQNCEEFQQLVKLYRTKTTMDILGVARQELPHSNFIKWLLDPKESHNLGDYGIRKMCEVLCYLYNQYGKDYLKLPDGQTIAQYAGESNPSCAKDPYKKQEAEMVDKRLLFYDVDSSKKLVVKALMTGDYELNVKEITREYDLGNQAGNKRRLDIFISGDFTLSDNKKVKIAILLENKVNSAENDNQTYYYLKNYLGKMANREIEAVDYIIPVFLYAVSNEDLKHAARGNFKEFPCVNHFFLLMNYQHLVDGVIAPCLTHTDDISTKTKIREYITCLGQSLNEDTDVDAKQDRELVMAVGPVERSLALRLWEQHERVLRDIGYNINSIGKGNHFIVNDSNRSFYRAILTPIANNLSAVTDEGSIATEDKRLIEAVGTEYKSTQVYHVRWSDGQTGDFASYQGKNKNIATLAYVIIKQFMKINDEQNNHISLADIREKLCEDIKGNWLCGILVTQQEVDEMIRQWDDAKKNLEASLYAVMNVAHFQNKKGAYSTKITPDLFSLKPHTKLRPVQFIPIIQMGNFEDTTMGNWINVLRHVTKSHLTSHL